MPANITISKIETIPDLGGGHRATVTFNVHAQGVQIDFSITVNRVGNPSEIAAEAQKILREFATDLQEALSLPAPLG
jgi:hypothetical protein